MPLVVCPDCEKQHSSAAATCPNCGRPNAVSTAPPQVMQKLESDSGGAGFLKFLGWIWILISIFSIFGAIGIQTAADEEVRRIEEQERLQMKGYVPYDPSKTTPTWLQDYAIPVAVAVLLQGVTIGTFFITYANNAKRGR